MTSDLDCSPLLIGWVGAKGEVFGLEVGMLAAREWGYSLGVRRGDLSGLDAFRCWLDWSRLPLAVPHP